MGADTHRRYASQVRVHGVKARTTLVRSSGYTEHWTPGPLHGHRIVGTFSVRIKVDRRWWTFHLVIQRPEYEAQIGRPCLEYGREEAARSLYEELAL